MFHRRSLIALAAVAALSAPGLALAHRFANAFPTAYREDFSPQVGAEDADMLLALSPTSPLAVKLYRPLDAGTGILRLKIYNTSKVALSDSLPVLERMGARVLDEHPYRIGNNGDTLWIHDLGLQLPADTDIATVKSRFEALFATAWRGGVESDDLNRLVLVTNLDARAISVLRAYTRYFKQLGFAFSQSYIEAALNKNASIAQSIVELFMARFDPAFAGDRTAAQQQIKQTLDTALVDSVTAIAGGSATLFAREGQDFVRIATNVKTKFCFNHDFIPKRSSGFAQNFLAFKRAIRFGCVK